MWSRVILWPEGCCWQRQKADMTFLMIANGTKLVKLKQVLFLFSFMSANWIGENKNTTSVLYQIKINIFLFLNLLIFCPGTKNRIKESHIYCSRFILFKKKMSNQIHFMSEVLYRALKLMIIFKSRIYLLQ